MQVSGTFWSAGTDRCKASFERGSRSPWMQRRADFCLGSTGRLYVAEIVRLMVETP